MDSIIYLDHAATTPLAPPVREAMAPWWLESFGNPTTLYSHGVRADEAIEAARNTIARLLGSRRSQEVYFTGGGTESINWALKGIALAQESGRIIVSAIEHSAVLETGRWLAERGFELIVLPVDGEGGVDPDAVAAALTPDTILVSIMHANNEIGTVEPIAQIGRSVAESSALFHVDAVQTLTHIPVDVTELGCDLLSASSHKFYGPKGTGFLYVKSGTRLQPLLHGGGQERELRSGTHNVPGIVGMARALELGVEQMIAEEGRIERLSTRLIDGIFKQIEGVTINGSMMNRLAGNVHVSITNTQGEALVLGLDLKGICVSTGSACSSASLEPSHVLKAIGRTDEDALGSLRFSLGRGTTEEQIDTVVQELPEEVERLRALSPRSL